MSERQYIAWDSTKGYPSREHVFFECLCCGAVWSSLPGKARSCRCDNMIMDTGRFCVKDDKLLGVFVSRFDESHD